MHKADDQLFSVWNLDVLLHLFHFFVSLVSDESEEEDEYVNATVCAAAKNTATARTSRKQGTGSAK